jgi:hypothetical protein
MGCITQPTLLKKKEKRDAHIGAQQAIFNPFSIKLNGLGHSVGKLLDDCVLTSSILLE